MDRTSSTRRLVAAGLLLGAIALGGCGGGGGGKPSPPSTPAAPGANVDPNATGTYTNPINKAKTTATNVNNHTTATDPT